MEDIKCKQTYSVERPLVVWNDRTGERLEIGQDRDGLDMIEIRNYTDDGTIEQRLCLTQEQWALIQAYVPEKG